jgi:hypothetical protein
MKYFLAIIASFWQVFIYAQVDSTKVKQHLYTIIKDFPNRNFQNLNSLDGCAQYIYDNFKQFGYDTHFQNFVVDRKEYKNVITSFGPANAPRIIVGAHYDVCGYQDGADDNASGLVGLLELSRLFKTDSLLYRIDLVAYSLEEPPYFRTENMGSYIHAQSLFDSETEVFGMICLEMIGYFNDAKKSQEYPLKILKLFYGGKGDYITLVRKFGPGKMAKKFKRKFKKQKLIKTKKFTAPGSLPGIDFSDHLNYWNFKYSAVMITNTGFYRNKNYHEKTDVIETLDIQRMCAVIQQVYQTIQVIATE